MIKLNLSAVFWLLWIATFVAHEFYALASKSDAWIPLTHVVRELTAHSYWFRLGVVVFCLWLLFHFSFVEVVAETVRRLRPR